MRVLLRRLLKPTADVKPLIEDVIAIRKRSDYIALCPTPTGSNWLGINRATHGLFPDRTLELPQEFSNSLLSSSSLSKLAFQITESGFKHVIFSGFPPYFEELVGHFQTASSPRLSCIFHGTLSELNDTGSPSAIRPFQLASEGKLNRIGVIRKDLVKPLGEIFDVACYELTNRCELIPSVTRLQLDKEKVHIGVLGSSGFNKNLHNQVVAALLVKNSVVHVADASQFKYLHAAGRIVSHGNALSRKDFLSVLGSMDINLYLSFSESYGQVVMESLELGVPCLVSPNTNVIDRNPALKEALTVSKIDDPTTISAKAMVALEERAGLVSAGMELVSLEKSHAEQLLKAFLTA